MSSEVVMSKDARMLRFRDSNRGVGSARSQLHSVYRRSDHSCWGNRQCRTRHDPVTGVIIEVLDEHFVRVGEDLRASWIRFCLCSSQTLSSLRNESRLCLDQGGIVVPRRLLPVL
jgi:hypothetical protein